MGDWGGTVPSFTAGQVLTAADMDTIADILTALTGDWSPWTPTLTNLSVGNGTLVARYRRIGKTVDFVIRAVLGASGASVGTNPSFSLPYTPAAHYVDANFGFVPIGSAYYLDAGTTTRMGIVGVLSGSTARFMWLNTSAAPTDQITSTSPWTWAAGDVLAAWGRYEAA